MFTSLLYLYACADNSIFLLDAVALRWSVSYSNLLDSILTTHFQMTRACANLSSPL